MLLFKYDLLDYYKNFFFCFGENQNFFYYIYIKDKLYEVNQNFVFLAIRLLFFLNDKNLQQFLSIIKTYLLFIYLFIYIYKREVM